VDRRSLLGIAGVLVPAFAHAGSVRRRDGSLAYRDPRLPPALPPRWWEAVLPMRPLASHGALRDPKYNQEYPFRMQVFCSSEAPGGGGPGSLERPVRAAVVHFRDPADLELAFRSAGVLARLHWVFRDYLGRGPVDGGYVDLWLRHEGAPSGEEFRRSVYLHAIREPRAPAEWVRELAHEYSHLYLPRVGPYLEPETWAEGYLGERLALKWLLHDNACTDLWGEPIDAGGYMRHQVEPVRNRFLDQGPSSPAARRRDEAGMLHHIGEILALEAMHGPSFLRALLDRFRSTQPEALGGAVARTIEGANLASLPVEPSAVVPSLTEPLKPEEEGSLRFRRVAYRLLLSGGDWRLQVEGRLPEGTRAVMEATDLQQAPREGEEGAEWTARLAAPNAIWRRFELAAPPGAALTIRAIRLRRIGA
jgi:hypothetical protein